jgi:hypothetical protein
VVALQIWLGRPIGYTTDLAKLFAVVALVHPSLPVFAHICGTFGFIIYAGHGFPPGKRARFVRPPWPSNIPLFDGGAAITDHKEHVARCDRLGDRGARPPPIVFAAPLPITHAVSQLDAPICLAAKVGEDPHTSRPKYSLRSDATADLTGVWHQHLQTSTFGKSPRQAP